MILRQVAKAHHHTADEAREWLREAVAIVEEVAPAEDLRSAALTAVYGTLSACQVNYEAMQANGLGMAVPKLG